jgi:hypothetical protein
LACTAGDLTCTDGGANNAFTLDTGASIPKLASNNAFTGADTFGKINSVCYVDGVQNATIAAAVTCAGASGTIVVPPAVGHYTFNSTIPAGVNFRIEAGAILDVALGAAPAINGPLDADYYQIFNVSSQAISAASITTNVAHVHGCFYNRISRQRQPSYGDGIYRS